MTKIACLILLSCLLVSATSIVDFPSSEISNGLIKVKLYLPDTANGYYRATRFDWSGVIPELEYKGHHYFDNWNQSTYSPKLNDAIMGPVQEFGPLGYNDVKPGESFVKIGVGGLKKIEERSYRYAFTYEIINPGKWTVKKKKDRVTYTHDLTDASGYSYRYSKVIQLIKGKPIMVLQHTLKNTGTKTINTNVYDHNFFVIDKEPSGPNMKMSFPFEAKAIDNGNGSLKGFGTIANIQDKSIIYTRNLNKGEQVYSAGLQGFGNTSEDYHITIENTRTGAGVKITGDQPLEKLVYWACPTTACPEPYIRLNVEPGKEIKWNYNYEFFTTEPSTK